MHNAKLRNSKSNRNNEEAESQNVGPVVCIEAKAKGAAGWVSNTLKS